MEKFFRIIIFIFWPFSLYLSNTHIDFIKIAFPSVFLGITLFMFKKKSHFFLFPLLAIPFIEPKLSLLPLLFGVLLFLMPGKKNISKFVYSVFLLFSLVLFIFSWKQFYGQTIFTRDREAEQQVVEKSNLYNSVLLARIYQNKPKIYLDKISSNFFALVDPNNYFFGFHPREISIDNQNLKKFPFVSIVYFLFGLYFFKNIKDKYFLLSLIGSLIFYLSILKVFDRTDFILWIPFCILVIYGYQQTKRFPSVWYLGNTLFLVFTIPELLRLLLKI